jgi:hypothetical protein
MFWIGTTLCPVSGGRISVHAPTAATEYYTIQSSIEMYSKIPSKQNHHE